MDVHQVLAVALAMLTVLGIIARPWRSSEWMWAVGGAIALLAVGSVTPAQSASAVMSGWNVYLFLAGILGLAELARCQGIFDWMAWGILRAGGGSQRRLFALLFGAGVIVTALLCNDTTAVVLTSAVVVTLHRAGLRALPYLYGCAFVAGAASFILPISNPANLVVFTSHLPALGPWFVAFAWPSFGAIAVVYISLTVQFRKALASDYERAQEPVALSRSGMVAAWCILAAALAIVISNAVGGWVGLTAVAGLALALLIVFAFDKRAPRKVLGSISWGVLPLVAGLFVVVAALDAAGAVGAAHDALLALARLPAWCAHFAIGGAVTVAANVFNNLPVALFAGQAMIGQSAATTHAAVVAIDLGPNLSVSGSLATLLWLVVLRRENVRVTPWQFLKVSAIATIPALIVAELLVR